MNSIIHFCIFSFILMQAATLDPFAGITRLKNTVESVSNDLTRYNYNLRFNFNIKLNNLKFSQMTNVNNAVNSALSDTRNAIITAKDEGRDAEHCYESIRLRLGDASKIVFSALDKCVKNQLDTLQSLEKNIESHLNAGKLLLLNFDGIAISCSFGNSLQTQQCVMEKMPAASQSVQNFKNTANLLKNTGNTLTNSGETNAVNCFQTTMNKLYEDVSAAQILSTDCIKASTK